VNCSMRVISIFTVLIIVAIPLLGKTRWSSVRTIPDADFIGSGEFIVGYDGFVNSNRQNEIFVTSQVPLSMGVGEWLTVYSAWSDGVTAGFKARILDEFHPAMPSLAVGVRNLYHNSNLTRGGVPNNSPEFTGEIYLAASKGFDLITTRFHGGVLSIPSSSTEQFNGFFGIEKYFGGSFYVSFEGFSLYDRFNLSLFGTLRFLKNDRAEIFAGLIDLERLLFNQSYDLDMSLEPDFPSDFVKPGIAIGFNCAFSLPFGKQTQFKGIEDLYLEQNKDLNSLRESQNSLSAKVETEHFRIDTLSLIIDSIGKEIIKPEILPDHYEEIYARLLAYRSKFESKPYDPEMTRKIQEQIFAFEVDAENTLLRVVKKGDKNPDVIRDAISLLSLMKSQKSVPLFLELLGETRERRMKISLISALGTIGDRNATYALKHIASSNDEAVATAAREILKTWEPESTITPTTNDNK